MTGIFFWNPVNYVHNVRRTPDDAGLLALEVPGVPGLEAGLRRPQFKTRLQPG